jgi:hypothetical protein
MLKFFKSKRGQSVIEYAILISAVAMVAFTMSAYVRRAAQAKIAIVQNQLNAAVK